MDQLRSNWCKSSIRQAEIKTLTFCMISTIIHRQSVVAMPGPTILLARTLDPQFGTAVPAHSNAAPGRNFHITVFAYAWKKMLT